MIPNEIHLALSDSAVDDARSPVTEQYGRPGLADRIMTGVRRALPAEVTPDDLATTEEARQLLWRALCAGR